MSAPRTASEMQAKLAELKERQKEALNARMVWSVSDLSAGIAAMEWALGLREDL